MIKIISFVSNDIVSDNRVHKTALTLQSMGYHIVVAGRRFKNSEKHVQRPYTTHRFRLLFNKGLLFYASLNIRIFFFLLGKQVDIILSNDLDTLPACWLAAVIKRKKLVFDSHELFSGVPELVHRPFVRHIWKLLENFLIRRVHYGITVSNSIAEYYYKKYGKQFIVVRNASKYREKIDSGNSLKVHTGSVILYQGALNLGRGIELAIRSMQHIKDGMLLIVGDGDISSELKKLAAELQLAQKVEFAGLVPIEKLTEYTAKARIGISLEEDMGLNYRFALPNKLFDYIQFRVPVVVSDLPEMSQIVKKYGIGEVLFERTPEKMGEVINIMIGDYIPAGRYNNGLEMAARELCWENEEEKLIGLFRHAGTST